MKDEKKYIKMWPSECNERQNKLAGNGRRGERREVFRRDSRKPNVQFEKERKLR